MKITRKPVTFYYYKDESKSNIIELSGYELSNNLCYKHIKHSKYKYKLIRSFVVKLYLTGFSVNTRYCKLKNDGTLIIYNGYAWNGANFVYDNIAVLRASLVHDCIYQLISENLIDKKYRNVADNIFINLCVEDGVNRIRTFIFKVGLKCFGWMYC